MRFREGMVRVKKPNSLENVGAMIKTKLCSADHMTSFVKQGKRAYKWTLTGYMSKLTKFILSRDQIRRDCQSQQLSTFWGDTRFICCVFKGSNKLMWRKTLQRWWNSIWICVRNLSNLAVVTPPMVKNGVDFLLTKGLILIKSHFLLLSKANERTKS